MRCATLAVLAVFITALPHTPAAAQNNRTFVSGTGTDAGNTTCARTSPCRSFSQAIGVTNAGGEVIALDSAGYGPFTISRSISISAEGVEAAITTPFNATGIQINAGLADVVNLRGLILIGSGGDASSGISFAQGGTLNVQNCAVRGFNVGINFGPSNAASMNVSDTVASQNTKGFTARTVAGLYRVFLQRVQAVNNGYGIEVEGDGVSPPQVVLANSTVSGNEVGLQLTNDVSVVSVSSNITQNNTGVTLENTQPELSLARSQVNSSANFPFFSRNGRYTLNTFGDNFLAANGSLVVALTPVAQQ